MSAVLRQDRAPDCAGRPVDDLRSAESAARKLPPAVEQELTGDAPALPCLADDRDELCVGRLYASLKTAMVCTKCCACVRRLSEAAVLCSTSAAFCWVT